MYENTQIKESNSWPLQKLLSVWHFRCSAHQHQRTGQGRGAGNLAALPADVGKETPSFASYTQSEQSNKLLQGEREKLAFLAPFLLYSEDRP